VPGHREKRFLPWVTAVRVRSNSDSEMVADLIVGFRSLRERFTSRVGKERAKRISVDYIDGPLKFLRNDWQFEPAPGGCTITFSVEFAFKNRVFEAIAGQMFDAALRKMINAFEARADALYASPSGISNSSATSAA
jgi:coenzyme Q-binding protein COQ10